MKLVHHRKCHTKNTIKLLKSVKANITSSKTKTILVDPFHYDLKNKKPGSLIAKVILYPTEPIYDNLDMISIID